MQQQYDAATVDMHRMTDDYERLKLVLEGSDGNLDALRQDNERLRLQVWLCVYLSTTSRLVYIAGLESVISSVRFKT